MLKASVDAEVDRVAREYAKAHHMWKSTIYAQALAWYLDSPYSKEQKERLSDAERRAMERGLR